jgi:hypothetical protein
VGGGEKEMKFFALGLGRWVGYRRNALLGHSVFRKWAKQPLQDGARHDGGEGRAGVWLDTTTTGDDAVPWRFRWSGGWNRSHAQPKKRHGCWVTKKKTSLPSPPHPDTGHCDFSEMRTPPPQGAATCALLSSILILSGWFAFVISHTGTVDARAIALCMAMACMVLSYAVGSTPPSRTFVVVMAAEERRG